MRRKTRANLNSAIAAVLISIPIIICKAKADAKPEANVRKPSEQEIELQIAWNTAEEPQAEIEVETWHYVALSDTEIITAEQETTKATFSGYDFIPLSAELQVNIFTICEKYEIAYDLILSVIKTESEFQWLIGDNGNSIGYMQIQPQWWQCLADAAGLNIHDPLDNVQIGTIILTDLLNANLGDLDKALKQYNSGDPNYQGNEYVEKVFENYQWILNQKSGE